MVPTRPTATRSPSGRSDGTVAAEHPEIIDRDEFRRLRLQAGTSTRALARAAATSTTTIDGIADATNHRSIDLGMLCDIACALGVHPAALLDGAAPATQARPDDSIIEAALAEVGGSPSATDLAEALGWPTSRAHAALRALKTRLKGTGQQLISRGWDRHSLKPDRLLMTSAQRRKLHRTALRQRGLNITCLGLLVNAHEGRLDGAWLRAMSNPQRVALATITNAGLVEPHDGGYRLTPEAVEALDWGQTAWQGAG